MFSPHSGVYRCGCLWVSVFMSVCAELGAFAVVCLCCLRALNRASDLPGKMPPNSSAVPSPCKYIGVSLSDDEMRITIVSKAGKPWRFFCD